MMNPVTLMDGGIFFMRILTKKPAFPEGKRAERNGE
jgi:hypothetical protein